jgi:hypothetical protein
MHDSLERPHPAQAHIETRSQAASEPLIVRLWFEAERGMQSSLHVGPSVHRFDHVMALVRFLLELADEPDVFCRCCP